MAFDFIEIVIILFYVSILVEIIAFPVPSVASSYQLFAKRKSLPEGYLYTWIQKFNLFQKIILLLIPTLLSIIAYCTPLILIFISKISSATINKTEQIGFIILAFSLILTGRIISLYSVAEIRQNNRQAGESFELKTSKLFSYSRNPILLGMYVSFAGMVILFPKWFLMAAFVFYISHMHFRILIEESFLRYKFGEKYVHYKKQTKRYF